MAYCIPDTHKALYMCNHVILAATWGTAGMILNLQMKKLRLMETEDLP